MNWQLIGGIRKVSKQALAILGANSIYEGAGSRIRTDDLLITKKQVAEIW